jgi:hypothetical protein
MQRVVIDVTPSGTTGSATATSTAAVSYDGKLFGVYFDAVATTASTVMRLKQAETPTASLFSVSATADGWYFPRAGLVDNAGTSTAGTAPYPITGRLAFQVSTSVPSQHTAYIYIEEQG